MKWPLSLTLIQAVLRPAASEELLHRARSSCCLGTCFKSLLSSLDNQLVLSFVYALLQVFQFVTRMDVDFLRHNGCTTIWSRVAKSALLH